MLSRRSLFGLGLSRVAARVEEQFDAQAREPAAPPTAPPPPRVRRPPRPNVPPPRPSWPHRRGAELWAPVYEGLPRPAGAGVLEVDDLDYDLARLPIDDASHDAAVSAFAPMFSSDGRAAIAELFRVVRPGGTVAFCAWAPAGVVGRLLTLAAEHDPPPPGVPAPLDWCSEGYLRHELDARSDDVELHPRELTLAFGSPGEAVDRLFAALRPLAWAPDQRALRQPAEEIVAEMMRGDAGGVRLPAGYVMAVARRRSA
jgi:SAM-dependent methyltransferase